MGNEEKVAHHSAYINVMESVVAEEVDRHLQKLPERVLKYVKRSEVETFALNRLPALYASSEKGLQHQQDRAIRELRPQITSAVRQAFAAVQVDPLRLSKPLQLDDSNHEAEAVLQALREWLRSPSLTWETALHMIRKLQQRNRSGTQVSHSSQETFSELGASPASRSLRPGTYGGRVSWQPNGRNSKQSEGFEDNYLR